MKPITVRNAIIWEDDGSIKAEEWERRGYEVLRFDVTNLGDSTHYNPIGYIKCEEDIRDFTKIMANAFYLSDSYIGDKNTLMQKELFSFLHAVISYIKIFCEEKDQNMESLLRMIYTPYLSDQYYELMDDLFDAGISLAKDPLLMEEYNSFRLLSMEEKKELTFALTGYFSSLATEEIMEITRFDEMNLSSFGAKKQVMVIKQWKKDLGRNVLVTILLWQILKSIEPEPKERMRL